MVAQAGNIVMIQIDYIRLYLSPENTPRTENMTQRIVFAIRQAARQEITSTAFHVISYIKLKSL